MPLGNPARTVGLLVACLIVAGSAGCGGKSMVKVEGVVTLDGTPVDGATVLFLPEGKGVPATGRTGSDGVFTLTTRTTGDGVEVGDYKVVITKIEGTQASSSSSPDNPDSMKAAYGKFIQESKKGKTKEGKSKLPASYGDEKTTTLRCQVPPPAGRVEFNLKSSGGS